MYNSYGVSPTILDSSPKFAASGIWTIVSVILAIIGGIVLYFTGFLGWLYDFLTFKKMMIENVLKILYIIVALFVTLSSFGLMSISFLAFLLTLVIGNVLTRVIYELLLVKLVICKNTTEINKKLNK